MTSNIGFCFDDDLLAVVNLVRVLKHLETCYYFNALIVVDVLVSTQAGKAALTVSLAKYSNASNTKTLRILLPLHAVLKFAKKRLLK